MKLTWRIWLLIIVLLLSLLAIRPGLGEGIIIKSVEKNSLAFQQGMRAGEAITSVNGQTTKTLLDYQRAVSGLFVNNQSVKVEISTDKNDYILFTNEPPAIVVQNKPYTRLKTGLDIQGGARALVQPEQQITDAQLQDLIEISNNRFNVFGISDVKIRGITDLSGNRFMLVEVAGAAPSDLENLISKQGKFEAKIGNQTVFVGGSDDVTSVCRNDATCAGITACRPSQGGYSCTFSFTIYLSEQAAKRHADITGKLDVDPTTGGKYLKENLSLVLDDVVADELLISSDLKGRTTTQISIQGSGTGTTQQDALDDAKTSMHKLQTILITGSIPYKLEIVKLDTISPLLGDQFVYRILLAGGISILAIAVVIFVRYRKIKLSLALLFTSFSEIIIILGAAALMGWNLDLAAIAGILATIGTGVDQQIVIVDEARSNRQSTTLKERMRRALFIVTAAYATAFVSLLPLYWAGAGLFKGFAITSIIGITAGVLITRPAFADMIKKIEG